ncbi:hypothetical protein ACQ4PT_009413 [Festuca glaucescens]
MAQSSSQRTNINSSPEVGGSTDMLPRLTGKHKLELEFILFKQQHCPKHHRRSEVDIYLQDALVPLREDESFDVLKWWKRNAENYPILAKIAQDFLVIPLSAVASESTFSTAGMIIDKHRSSLNPETTEGLICTKDWLKEYLSEDDDDEDDGTEESSNSYDSSADVSDSPPASETEEGTAEETKSQEATLAQIDQACMITG